MCYVVKEVNDNYAPGSFVASFPKSWRRTHPNAGFVRLLANGQRRSFRTVIRSTATGNVVFVDPDTFALRGKTKPITVAPISETQYRLDRLLASKGGRIDAIGLACVVFGMSVPLSFNLGKIVPLVPSIGEAATTWVQWLASAIGLIGVILVGIRRVAFRDE